MSSSSGGGGLQLNHLVAGVSGGFCSTLVVHPLDLLKVRFAADEGNPNRPRYTGYLDASKSIVKSGGISGLFLGATPNLIGNMLSWGLYFQFYTIIKSWLGVKADYDAHPMKRILAGGLSGIVVLSLTNPIWVVKTRICMQYEGQPKVYKGIFDALVKTYRSDGIRGWYKGYTAGLLGTSHGAVQLMVYEEMKRMYCTHYKLPCDSKLMVFSSPPEKPPVVAYSSMPLYCMKVLGSKHLFVGGGGGAAKTGIPNELRVYSVEADKEKLVEGGEPCNLHTKLTECATYPLETQTAMNCDLFDFDSNLGRFLVATGQDCELHLYTAEYVWKNEDSESESLIPKLGFRFTPLKHIQTDFAAKLPAQKVVRFAPMEGKFLATGGADGHLRVWSWPALNKVFDVDAHNKKEIDTLDVSKDDKFIITVGQDHNSYIWSAVNGEKIMKLPTPSEIPEGLRVKFVRFTCLGSKSHVFVTANIPIKYGSKNNVAYLVLWVYNPLKSSCRPAATKLATKDIISTMNISNDSSYIAIGTINGDVGIFDTAELYPIKYLTKTHGIFVTGVDFLPLNPAAGQQDTVGLRYLYPDCKAVVLSISADNTVQLHQIKWQKQKSFSRFVYKTVLWFMVLYFVLKLLRL